MSLTQSTHLPHFPQLSKTESAQVKFQPAKRKAFPTLFTVPPPQPRGKEKPGQLNAQQLKQYFEEGYLLLPTFFKPQELRPVREAVALEVERLANRLHNAGNIKGKYEDADLFHRLTLIEKEFPGAAVVLMKSGRLPKAFQELWTNERILNVMEQLIGPEIAGHPAWNLRSKTPVNEQLTVPWHQDNCYLDDSSQEVLQPTLWVPLLDVNEHNGCIQVARGGHRTGVLAEHTCCVGGTWYVEVSEEEMETTLGLDITKDVVTCSLPFGGVLLMNNLVPHRSLDNKSDRIRWSLDLRYQTPDKSPGLFGLKDTILFRTAKDLNHTIQWDDFIKVDRSKQQTDMVQKSKHSNEDDEFDTTLIGPWMNRWKIVNHNRHTANRNVLTEA